MPRLLATLGHLGYAPIAPGTIGSLAAALAFLFLPTYLPTFWFLSGLTFLFVIAVWSAGQMADSRHADPSEVIIDEVVGMAVTVAFLPLTVHAIGTGFVLFRILDVVKPFPARQAEKLPGGWGIVMDDVIAGIYANLMTRLILLIIG